MSHRHLSSPPLFRFVHLPVFSGNCAHLMMSAANCCGWTGLGLLNLKYPLETSKFAETSRGRRGRLTEMNADVFWFSTHAVLVDGGLLSLLS